jgi:hypothetical protein
MKEEVHPKTSKASIVTICNYFLKIRLLSGEWIQIAVREHSSTDFFHLEVRGARVARWPRWRVRDVMQLQFGERRNRNSFDFLITSHTKSIKPIQFC